MTVELDAIRHQANWVELPDHATATQLFHIAQEAVSNALRHGRPRHIRLTLLTEPDGLRLRIRDDGIGIPGAPAPSDGLGLRIMHYRAGQIGDRQPDPGRAHVDGHSQSGVGPDLVQPRRPTDLAAAIRTFASQPALRQHMGASSRVLAEKEHDMAANWRRIFDLMGSVAGRPGGAPSR